MQPAVQRHPAHELRVDEVPPPPAAHLPDALVLPVPVVGHPVYQIADVLPGVVTDRGDILVAQVGRVHQLAVDVELKLAVGGVADADRLRPRVTVEVRQLLFGQVGPAVHGIHELERSVAVRVALLPARGQPVPELGCLFGESDSQEGIHRERGVADPGVAVVPVPHPADPLRQAGGRGGDDRPGRLVGEQLQRQCRAQDHLAPPAPIGAVGYPPLPVINRSAEPVLGLRGPGTPSGVVIGGDDAQDERGAFALAEGERGHRPVAVAPEGDRSGQPQGQAGTVEAGAVRAHCSGVARPGVVERRAALHLQRQPAADHPDPADELGVRPGAGPHRHVVLDLGDAIGMQEAGDKDVGFRPVVLLVAQLAGRGRGDPEAPPFVGVEDRPKHAGRVEARQAEPIDRPVQADQGGAVHVADDTVVLDRLVAHRRQPPVAISSPATQTPRQKQCRDIRALVGRRGGTSLTRRSNPAPGNPRVANGSLPGRFAPSRRSSGSVNGGPPGTPFAPKNERPESLSIC